MSWDHEVDVVVLGSGGAGLTAALTAVVAGASVEVYEKAATVGGTTAVSGGIVWIPAHNRSPDGELTPADALQYLRAQSLGSMDDELVETFVRTGPAMLDFIEAHSGLQFEIATGFPDYRPELPGGRPTGGRSLSAAPFDLAQLGEWATRITSFPADWSNVGFDAETRARLHAAIDERTGHLCVAGTALIAGLLKGLLDAGVTPHTNARAEELIADGSEVTGVRVALPERTIRVRARRGVILGTGGFEWDPALTQAFLRGPMHGAVSPPNDTGDGLRMAMAHGADLANMGEAWWVPIVQIPGDTIEGKPRSRSVRLERTRPRSIIVNSAGQRFVNEACDYNSMAGAFHYLDPRGGYVNDRGWMVFDSVHLQRYGFLGVEPGQPVPDWFCESADLAELAAKTGIDPGGLARTVESWNRHVADGEDPDFGRGSSAYDGYWGDDSATTQAGKTLGPIDTAPYYAVPVSIGAMGTKGGPRTDHDARVLHVGGEPIPGLFAAGNAMGGVTGRAYGGAGGTLGPAMVFGYRAGHAAATGKSVDLK
ncbi:FAD-dependent oxidoreductase [Mycobacterium intracellulare]|uniref:FAD binding domain-containing protein n=1 Tax=Mycobacterium intracellulare (strain ATCC 13950 / DSM 43223 / JCM 6384 / NCTC 13025 / 3600) TaxID=487521 RepID=H8IQZ7_MYCIA|nr:FAD-dependent oxidoreductase [Mycobacterium intracellulare]AFC41952.1 FAD binding domain-containing protein [Mycobacterium intracellulare ATCC 13950]AFC47095.1 FAD binding domain-containing protein [Mycobacterium intracellulare MOTT-02]ASW93955.1 FAD-binding protein [Mycobacterium intracellulare]ETZ38872.1 FAD binding domain protein [Mycobacterium intracellulare MIN_061107_1834]MCA2232557.1 FAD-dependent oxidoreductase [Mycobacterium intracellulare]